MKAEWKELDGRDAALFIQDLVDELMLEDEQVDLLEFLCLEHEVPVVFWRESDLTYKVGPK